jgi:hypothetical protein
MARRRRLISYDTTALAGSSQGSSSRLVYATQPFFDFGNRRRAMGWSKCVYTQATVARLHLAFEGERGLDESFNEKTLCMYQGRGWVNNRGWVVWILEAIDHSRIRDHNDIDYRYLSDVVADGGAGFGWRIPTVGKRFRVTYLKKKKKKKKP